MLDELHYDAYAAARGNLLGLFQSADPADAAGIRYLDLATSLELLHSPEDLAGSVPITPGPRAALYAEAQRALSVLRDHDYVDALEIRLIIGNLDIAWEHDGARGADYVTS